MRDDMVLPVEQATVRPALRPTSRIADLAWSALQQVLPVLGVLLALLALWEGSKLLLAIPDSRLPHVVDVISVLFTRTQGGEGPLLLVRMLQNAWATFGVALGGFVFGGVLGFLLALLFTQLRVLELSLMPYVIGSQTVPILAIAPMVVVGLGQLGAPGWVAKAIVAAYLTFFPVTIGMLRGLRAATPEAVALMHSYAANRAQIFFKLRLPASLPYLFTSLKIAATASVIGAIVAELPAGSQFGIGVVIIQAAQFYNSRPPVLFAAILVAGSIGLVFYGLVVLAERLIVGPRAREV
ncbi:MAG: ABC transporter permease subunit [Chloroflexaceae bacterium]|nr:ABC transporter permease subunit [Chloroflexaceae bacterium]NJL33042.1 ABC transporter permease subunit [Chloroflexaceae bacterium]NJO07036.1 ABC transporter permease subunit [Chloroflexaceae bacterium]